jgi:hypothetical protein
MNGVSKQGRLKPLTNMPMLSALVATFCVFSNFKCPFLSTPEQSIFAASF